MKKGDHATSLTLDLLRKEGSLVVKRLAPIQTGYLTISMGHRVWWGAKRFRTITRTRFQPLDARRLQLSIRAHVCNHSFDEILLPE